MRTCRYRLPKLANKHSSRIPAPPRRLLSRPLKLRSVLPPSSGCAMRLQTAFLQTHGLPSSHRPFSTTPADYIPFPLPSRAPTPARRTSTALRKWSLSSCPTYRPLPLRPPLPKLPAAASIPPVRRDPLRLLPNPWRVRRRAWRHRLRPRRSRHLRAARPSVRG